MDCMLLVAQVFGPFAFSLFPDCFLVWDFLGNYIDHLLATYTPLIRLHTPNLAIYANPLNRWDSQLII